MCPIVVVHMGLIVALGKRFEKLNFCSIIMAHKIMKDA